MLLNTGPLHSSLYSLLNRHYTVSPNATTGEPEAFVTMAMGSLARSVRVHPAARIIVHLPASALARTPRAFLNRFERFSVGLTEALEEVVKGALARPPQWLATFDAAMTRGPFLSLLQSEPERFIAAAGAEGFHGLLQGRGGAAGPTTAALLLAALRSSTGLQLSLPEAYRYATPNGGAAAACGRSARSAREGRITTDVARDSAADSGEATDPVDSMLLSGELVPKTLLQASVRRLNFTLLQQLTVGHMLQVGGGRVWKCAQDHSIPYAPRHCRPTGACLAHMSQSTWIASSISRALAFFRT